MSAFLVDLACLVIAVMVLGVFALIVAVVINAVENRDRRRHIAQVERAPDQWTSSDIDYLNRHGMRL